jgi:hypothetical protein
MKNVMKKFQEQFPEISWKSVSIGIIIIIIIIIIKKNLYTHYTYLFL